MTKQQVMAEVPFNSILIPEEENARAILTNIEGLASSIKTDGLLTALTVTNGGPEGTPYILKAGFRRGAALKLLKWGSKPVPVIITSAEDGVIKNLVENIQREDLPSIDLAQRLHLLETGEAPGGDGKKYAKKELAARLNMSLSHVSNLIRADKNLCGEAKKLWRKLDIPTSTIFAWAGLSEEEQEAAILKWKRDQEKAKEREAAKAAKASDKPSKSSKEDDGEESSGARPLVKGKNASNLNSYKEILEWKLETGQIKAAAEKEAALRQVDTLRFLLGDLSRFPGVSATDTRAYEKYLKEQVEAEKAAEESEEE